MYFALSKLLVFSIKPLNWVVVLLIIAAVCRAEKWRKRYLRTAALVLIFCSNPWIINQLILRWETGYRSPDSIAQPYPVGIVLGGFMNLDGTAPPGNYTMLRAGNRLLTAMQLYHQGKIKRILISGGAGRLLGTANAEAPVARRYLLDNGIPDSVILVEDRSRNTLENGLFTRQLLDSLGMGQQKHLLITSAWHLRRAAHCFEKAAVNFDIYGTDFLGERPDGNFFQQIEPSWDALMQWDLLLKEWVGYVVN